MRTLLQKIWLLHIGRRTLWAASVALAGLMALAAWPSGCTPNAVKARLPKRPSLRIAARPAYTITDLGVVDGYAYSIGDHINSRGEIAGGIEDADDVDDSRMDAFFSVPGRPMQDIGTLGSGLWTEAYSLNNAGQVAGISETKHRFFRAFVWQNGRMTNLGTLGGEYSAAYGINNHGQAVGVAETLSGNRAGLQQSRHIRPMQYKLWPLERGDHAFLWQNGQMTDISARCPGVKNGATAINDQGDIAGIFSSDGVYERAFVLRHNRAQVLATLGGDVAFAVALNRNMVIGYSTIEGGNSDVEHGCVWQNSRIQDIGTLGGENSEAWGVNERGQVVGSADDAEEYPHAVLWQNGTLTDLNTRIAKDSGWYLTQANGINDQGQIVGAGLINDHYHAFLLTPQK